MNIQKKISIGWLNYPLNKMRVNTFIIFVILVLAVRAALQHPEVYENILFNLTVIVGNSWHCHIDYLCSFQIIYFSF